MPKVYIVQEPTKFDPVTRTHKPRIDLTPAQDFGELVFLTSPGMFGLDPTATIQGITAKLADLTEEDFILCVGAPELIGWTMAIAAKQLNGHLKTLSWRNDETRYVVRSARLW